jgi:acetylornithine deacetylase
MSIEVDQDYIQDILSKMVSIDSVNPSLVADGAGEGNIARYIAKLLENLGMQVKVDEFQPGRFNTVGVLPGKGKGRSLLLTGHMDVVGVEGMSEPFVPNVHGGRMYGRGTFDMKGGLAAAIGAIKAIRDNNIQLAGDLYFAAVADEEYASIGTEHFLEDYRADAAIITEPSGMSICRAHKGFIWFEVETRGKAAHGSDYQRGIDAISHMGRVLVELEKLAVDQQSLEPHALLGLPSLHASLISGGVELSTYPPDCTLKAEWRTLPRQDDKELMRKVQRILDHLSERDEQFSAKLTQLLTRYPFEISPRAEIVQTVVRSSEEELGIIPDFTGMSGWGDSGLFADAGIDVLLYGPSGDGAHAQEEWVDLHSVGEVAAVLCRTAQRFCR